MIKLALHSLKFNIADDILDAYQNEMQSHTESIRNLKTRAGQESQVFKDAQALLQQAIDIQKPLDRVISEKIHLRALALELANIMPEAITDRLLSKMNEINRNKPSALLLEAFYSYFIRHFDYIPSFELLRQWLQLHRKKSVKNTTEDALTLNQDAPEKIIATAKNCGQTLEHFLSQIKLDRHPNSRLIEKTKQHYYIQTLKDLKPNEDHAVLSELRQPQVFNSPFKCGEKIGHQVLKILIAKAPQRNVSETWQQLILNIAGDPRVASGHPNYINWWQFIPNEHIQKVRGWLSATDIKLFLEAFEDYAKAKGDDDMLRMYPPRKEFLEGLLEHGNVVNTRLYLSVGAKRFVNSRYKDKDLPNYSEVTGNPASIIYVQLEKAHIIEGSHSCKLWIHKDLPSTSPVLNYDKNKLTFSTLTQKLSELAKKHTNTPSESIIHSRANFNWQRKALSALKALNVPIKAKHVLSKEDYKIYKRRYGSE